MRRNPACFLVAMSCILCLSVEVLAGCRAQKTATSAIDDDGPSLLTKVPSGPPELGLRLVSEVFSEGITGCWRLSDGTLLLEGPEGACKQYAIFYPEYDGARSIAASEFDCTVKEIGDGAITFIARGGGGVGLCLPYLRTYDIEESQWRGDWEDVYLPITQPAESGLDLPSASQGVLIEEIHIHDNLVEINYQETTIEAQLYVSYHGDSKAKQFIMEIPDAAVDSALSLPLDIAIEQGLIRAVHADKGTSRDRDRGITVFVDFDSRKWDRLTYAGGLNPTGGNAESMSCAGIEFYDDRAPTDLTIRVKR